MHNNKQNIESMRRRYPAGTRVKLNSMTGESRMPAGLEGSIQFVDDIGSLHVDWDNGSTLALIPGEDSFLVMGPGKQENTEAQATKLLDNDLQMNGM
ncbi:MAG: DUF4314 domain-containing protein [Saccharofermentanales bacterium]